MNKLKSIGHKGNMALINESLELKVKDLASHSFHTPTLVEMCESASRDDLHGIRAPKSYPNHELWGAGKNAKFEEWDTQKQIKFLLVHGFTSECIFSQAWPRKTA
ncbi:MAG: hypothetical protein C9356_11740 [Oleiphilus sp.]|nr:MAG: hypothetical protein C9356_11740 [Oleiphilus sp.]